MAPKFHQQRIEILSARVDGMLAYGKTKIIYDDVYESEDYNDNLDLPDERPRDHFIRYHDMISLTNAIDEVM